MRTWMIAATALAVGVVAGVAGGYFFRAEVSVLASHIPLGPEWRAREALQGALYDPDSLRLRSVERAPSGAICGEYNAKNRSGGYAGYSWFVVLPDGSLALDPSNDPDRTLEDLRRFRDALVGCE